MVPEPAPGVEHSRGGVAPLRPRWCDRLVRLVARADGNPVRFFVVLVGASALAYVPLALIYSPWAWSNVGPVGLQLSRPLLYLVYFFAGFAVGPGPRSRPARLRLGFWRGVGRHGCRSVTGFVLWAVPTSATLADWDSASLAARLAASLGFVVACAAGCLVLVAVCLRFGRRRIRAFDSLSANAYGMYIVHYVFAVWLQYGLLDFGLFAVGKASIVFGGTLIMSWVAALALGAAALRGISLGSQTAATKREVSRA